MRLKKLPQRRLWPRRRWPRRRWPRWRWPRWRWPRPSWKKDHQTEQKLNEKEAKWVSGPSSLLCLQDEEEGESEGAGLRHGGKRVGTCRRWPR